MSMFDRERHHLVDRVIAQSTTQDGWQREMVFLGDALPISATKPVEHGFQWVMHLSPQFTDSTPQNRYNKVDTTCFLDLAYGRELFSPADDWELSHSSDTNPP
ncbi:hypothetical protein [Rhodococcus sp. 24CO]|uniref:hypothetical protein n=1 Tax=Rhodococcus sp. 24CO TaxID=3117460 RepID=UPI003D3565CD